MPNLKDSVHELQSRTLGSPLGAIHLAAATGKLCSLTIEVAEPLAEISLGKQTGEDSPSGMTNNQVLDLAEQQLGEYFAGQRKVFDIPMLLGGTRFQQSIWARLAEIPFGNTSSYGELARAVGSPQAARAVGGAVGANPIPIVIGCHRILASNRALTGYSGGHGLDTKRWLLQHEAIEWRN